MEDGVISNRIESYIRENVWNKIDDKVFAFVNKLTLKDITDDYLKKDSSPMYYI